MITFKFTREGLVVARYLPVIISGDGEGGLNSSSDSPSPLKITEKGGEEWKK